MRKGFWHWNWVLLVSNIMFTADKIFRQDFGFRIRFWDFPFFYCFKVLFSSWIACSMHFQCFVWNFWVNGFPLLWLFYHVNLGGLYMRKGFWHWNSVLLVSNIMFTADKIFRQDFGFRIRFWGFRFFIALKCFSVPE